MQTNKPFYKKWWFWILTVIVILTANIFRSSSESAASYQAEPRSAQVKQVRLLPKPKVSNQPLRKKSKQKGKSNQLQKSNVNARSSNGQMLKSGKENNGKKLSKSVQPLSDSKSKNNLNYKKSSADNSNASSKKLKKSKLPQVTITVEPYMLLLHLAEGYHFSPNCRGLRPANGNITKMTLQQAINQGYTLCKWEDQ